MMTGASALSPRERLTNTAVAAGVVGLTTSLFVGGAAGARILGPPALTTRNEILAAFGASLILGSIAGAVGANLPDGFADGQRTFGRAGAIGAGIGSIAGAVLGARAGTGALGRTGGAAVGAVVGTLLGAAAGMFLVAPFWMGKQFAAPPLTAPPADLPPLDPEYADW